MRPGFRQWFAERAELVVLGLTLLATASLVVWWTILLGGEMRANELLERNALAAQVDLSEQQRQQRRLAHQHHVATVMVRGDFGEPRVAMGKRRRVGLASEQIDERAPLAAAGVEIFEPCARVGV